MRMHRIKTEGEAYYHLVSRCCLQSFLLHSGEKAKFLKMLGDVAYFSGVEILSFCIMDNHVHILAHVLPCPEITVDILLDRCARLYGDEEAKSLKIRWERMSKGKLAYMAEVEQAKLRARMGDISRFMQCLKQRYSIWYGKNHGKTGTIWQGRFGSTLVEGSDKALSAVSAYIDLNPVRAGITEDPSEYKWSGFGKAMHTDLEAMRGLARIYDPQATAEDFLNHYAGIYRENLYLTGSDTFSPEEVQKVLDAHGKLPVATVLRMKWKLFTCGGILGSKKFVDAECKKHPDAFRTKRKRGAKGIGLCDAWSGAQFCAARDIRKNAVTVTTA